jgi:hypothetical protein
MAISPFLLNALANPTIVAIADDTAAATALSAPTYTSLNTFVTFTELGAAWGATRAAQVQQTLQAASAAGNALAGYALTILSGKGFLPSNANAAETIAALVTAGICTQDEANAATCSVSYPLGYVVATADVTAARAVLAQYQQIVSLQTQLPQFFGNAMNEVLAPMLASLLAGNAVTVPASIDAMLTTWEASLNADQ